MKIYKYGDNVDTDVIIPARYLNAPDEKSLASHCMEDIDSTFASTVEAGDIVVGGANLGLRRKVRHCQELCPHLLPQRHQHRLSHPRMPRSGGRHQPGRCGFCQFQNGDHH